VAEGDYVMLHGRFSGRGHGRAWIAADIVRMEDGRLAEHWDVLQDEATKEESKSGLPMFGTSFAEPDQQPAPAATASSLTVEEARRIVAPLYDALNEPSKKDVAALLAKAANPDYRSYSTNEDWLTRDQLADVFKMLGSAVPNLSWTIEDIQTFGDQIVVRGEATGMPTCELFGAKPTGKSFKTMAVDLFTVKNGKLASAYHVENWMTALQQISK
jgi:predicted ester cyclase